MPWLRSHMLPTPRLYGPPPWRLLANYHLLHRINRSSELVAYESSRACPRYLSTTNLTTHPPAHQADSSYSSSFGDGSTDANVSRPSRMPGEPCLYRHDCLTAESEVWHSVDGLKRYPK